MLLNLTELSDQPLHRQFSDQVLEKILAGEFPEGDQPISISTLARRHLLSVRTVERALQTLQRMGMLAFEKGGGYRVARPSEKRKADDAGLTSAEFTALYLEKLGIEDDFRMARQIQKDLLPSELAHDDRYSISAQSEPCRIVRGDFYDFFTLPRGRLGIVIADASGKGLPAALIASQVQSILRSEVVHGNSIEQILSNTNRQFAERSSSNRFTTLFYGEYDPRTGSLRYANAGHNSPYVVSPNRELEQLDVGGVVLGVFPDARYKTASACVQPGAFVCLFTDGIIETLNRRGEEYGERHLRRLLKGCNRLGARQIQDLILDDVDHFRGSALSHDDATLVILKRVEE